MDCYRDTMRRPGIASAVLLAGALVVGCQSSSGQGLSNRFGDCTFAPHAVCTGQNLAALTLDGSDLTGADFSGSDFSHADLRNVILRNANLKDANLVGADLSHADLRNANLSGAALFTTRLDNADWTGSNRTGARFCQTRMPDGTMSACPDLESIAPPAQPKPPAIEVFAVHRPLRCLDDGVGEGFEVDWKTLRASNVAFLIDDIRASTASGNGGVQRLPMKCDNRQHVVVLQAFGSTPPLASKSLTVSLAPPPGG
jgi:hypothetical protein